MSFTMGGSAQTGQQSGSTQNDLPPWLKDAYLGNLGSAQSIAASPYEGYGGSMTAGDNEFLAASRDQAAASGRVGQDERNLAAQRFGEAGNMSPMFIDAAQTGDVLDVSPERAVSGGIPGSDLSGYQNPYESDVVQRALADVDLQRDRQANADNAATPSGAFGGSRQGVGDALRNERFDQQQLDTAASLRQGGFDRATGLKTSDLNRDAQTSAFNASAGNAAMTGNADRDIMARISDAERRQAASYANQNNELATAGINLQGAQGLLQTANDKQGGVFSTQGALQAAGTQRQGQQQSELDAAYSEFMRRQQDPYTKQGLLNSTVFGIPASSLGSTDSKSKSSALGVSASGGTK